MVRLSVALLLVGLCLFVYCLVDAIRTPQDEVRNLPKIMWVLLALFLPVVGSLAWLFAGRPKKAPRGPQRTMQFPKYGRQQDRQGRATASNPDDDEEFLRQVRRRVEEQRRRREEQRKRDEQGGATPPDEEA